MKTKLTIPVIILLSIIMLGCKNRSNIKSTALSEEDYLYLYSNDTLIITTADGPLRLTCKVPCLSYPKIL